MKNQKIISALFVMMPLILSGCNFIGGVFKTGVGVGVFIVVALLVIIFLISRIGRKKVR